LKKKLFLRKARKAKAFLRIRKEILEEQQLGLRNKIIGDERERRVARVLQELKDERVINDFLSTGALSFMDIMRGFDFYVISIHPELKSRIITRLSVTGERWVEKQKKKHPENAVIAVNLGESTEVIKRRLKGLLI